MTRCVFALRASDPGSLAARRCSASTIVGLRRPMLVGGAVSVSALIRQLDLAALRRKRDNQCSRTPSLPAGFVWRRTASDPVFQ